MIERLPVAVNFQKPFTTTLPAKSRATLSRSPDPPADAVLMRLESHRMEPDLPVAQSKALP
jgi:hypothetical protein